MLTLERNSVYRTSTPVRFVTLQIDYDSLTKNGVCVCVRGVGQAVAEREREVQGWTPGLVNDRLVLYHCGTSLASLGTK